MGLGPLAPALDGPGDDRHTMIQGAGHPERWPAPCGLAEPRPGGANIRTYVYASAYTQLRTSATRLPERSGGSRTRRRRAPPAGGDQRHPPTPSAAKRKPHREGGCPPTGGRSRPRREKPPRGRGQHSSAGRAQFGAQRAAGGRGHSRATREGRRKHRAGTPLLRARQPPGTRLPEAQRPEGAAPQPAGGTTQQQGKLCAKSPLLRNRRLELPATLRKSRILRIRRRRVCQGNQQGGRPRQTQRASGPGTSSRTGRAQEATKGGAQAAARLIRAGAGAAAHHHGHGGGPTEADLFAKYGQIAALPPLFSRKLRTEIDSVSDTVLYFGREVMMYGTR